MFGVYLRGILVCRMQVERKYRIHIVTVWSTYHQGNFNPVSEERNKVQDCLYLFEMDSSIACSPEASHLSVGSILLVM